MRWCVVCVLLLLEISAFNSLTYPVSEKLSSYSNDLSSKPYPPSNIRASVAVLESSPRDMEADKGMDVKSFLISLPTDFNIRRVVVRDEKRSGVPEEYVKFSVSTHRSDLSSLVAGWADNDRLNNQVREIRFSSEGGWQGGREVTFSEDSNLANIVIIKPMQYLNSYRVYHIEIYVLESNGISIIHVPILSIRTGYDLELNPYRAKPTIDLSTFKHQWVVDFGTEVYLDSLHLTLGKPGAIRKPLKLSFYFANDPRLHINNSLLGTIRTPFDLQSAIDQDQYTLVYAYRDNAFTPGEKKHLYLEGKPKKTRILIIHSLDRVLQRKDFPQIGAEVIVSYLPQQEHFITEKQMIPVHEIRRLSYIRP